MLKRLVHFGAATVSAYLYAQLTPMFFEFLLKTSFALFGFPKMIRFDCEGNEYPTDNSFEKFCWFTSWLVAYLICEFARRYKADGLRQSFLNHLRYGPLAAFVIFMLLAPVGEWEAIEKSKWKIRDYIENGSVSNYEAYESVYVKNLWNYRSVWDSPEYHVYAETAAKWLQSDNPMVRVRALKMSSRFYNWEVHPYRSPFIEALKNSRNEKDIIFREEANEYIRQLHTSCIKADCLECYFLRKALSLNALNAPEERLEAYGRR
jgi:hypothetical protein